jgi:hypothetical protein
MGQMRRMQYAPIILFVFCLLISGCVTQPPAKNTSLSLPSVYTAPIGGFEKDTAVTIDPNSTFEAEYTFYSKSWGPGEVKYSMNLSYLNKTYPVDGNLLSIEPSRFFAEPNHIYKSRVFLNTRYLPGDFFEPVNATLGGAMYPAGLRVDASLSDNSTNFGSDFILLKSFHSGPFNFDRIIVEKCSITIKRGEMGKVNMTFLGAPDAGIREIKYILSQTPLNVTIHPPLFIAKHHLEFPSTIQITADPSLEAGRYPVSITISGLKNDLSIECNNIGPSGHQTMPMNVTVE